MSFPRYPKYKDSGREWVGQVPEHWEVVRLRYLCQCLDGARVPLNASQRADKPGDIPYWGANSIVDRVDEALFEEDLVLLGEDGAPFFESSKPVAFFTQGKVWPNNHIHVLRPMVPGTGRFIVHVLNVTDYAQFIDGSTRDKLTQDAMNDIPLAWPPFPEQTLIALFLDRETAKIDELVREQRRLIELLKEKRQAVISHAVTKGLNPRASMQPSGTEWLGDVPEHWRGGIKLKDLAQKHPASFTNGPFGSDLLTSELQDGGVPVIYIRDLKVGGYLRTSTGYVTEVKARQLDRFRVDAHDVLIAKVGDPPGFCCTYPAEERAGIICQDVIRMKPNLDLISPRYLCYLLNSSPGAEAIDSICVELTRKRFSLADLQSLRFPIPPPVEQDEIVRRLQVLTGDFDALTAEAQYAIGLLQERRTALISAAVTGKIDVRGLVEAGAA